VLDLLIRHGFVIDGSGNQFPLGIPCVIVNGTVVVDSGQHTGALPGRALRYGR
jgi:N-acyl-D-aspartate/D-glutamate deacylase